MHRDRPNPPLDDPSELLFRQVHPSWMRDGRPSSMAFVPSRKDDYELSVSLESLTTPEGAYRHHGEALELKTAGTWAVSVADVHEELLLAYPDPIPASDGGVPSPAHAIIDFVPVASNNQREAKGTHLARKAVARGRLYPLVSPSERPPPESAKR
jgi:hypothetical protein